MICRKCGSSNVTTQTVAEKKKRGCFATCMWILLALCTCGMVIFIPLLMGKGSKTVTYAVCNNCGNRWRIG